ncbi:MAG: DUF192 domain-containing protein [Chloroflexi bacterium]|nr:MAG: DUF192 domain-containing protein [Chloroflexota bacterium]
MRLTKQDGSVVAEPVEVARNFFARGMGLMGRARLPENSGLVIDGCNGIHMMFMRFPIRQEGRRPQDLRAAAALDRDRATGLARRQGRRAPSRHGSPARHQARRPATGRLRWRCST